MHHFLSSIVHDGEVEQFLCGQCMALVIYCTPLLAGLHFIVLAEAHQQRLETVHFVAHISSSVGLRVSYQANANSQSFMLKVIS